MEISNIKLALISGAFAVLGSSVTGLLLVYSNQVIAEKDIRIKTSEIVQINHDVLREKSEVFMNGVYDFFLVLYNNPHASKLEIDKAILELQKKAMALSIYSSPELGKASRELVLELSTFPHSTTIAEDTADKVVSAFDEWHKQFYIETSNYSLELMPNSFVRSVLLRYVANG
ncbi:TPA: hypothetical protein N2810_004479 [Vibrio parahaemolyticus]|nr:hypothetical protein [Vibrio parahaemolyticus]